MMKKQILTFVSITILIGLTVPTAIGADNTDNIEENTKVNISIGTEGNINSHLYLHADGSISLIVDGVPLQQKFNSIDSALEHLSEGQSKLAGRINKNKKFIKNVKEWVETHEKEIGQIYTRLSVHDNRLEIVLSNTKYNKRQHMALENYTEASLEDAEKSRTIIKENLIDARENIESLKDRAERMEMAGILLIIVFAGLFTGAVVIISGGE